ncbi:MAG: glycosyltransferase, partial [Vicinamibacterales bacterium]
MRIGLQTWGSEGDIRPFVALGAALVRRGHRVELLYTEIGDRRYEDVARSLGFTARAIASPILKDARAQTELGLRILQTRHQLEQGLIISRELLEPVIDPLYEAAEALCRRSDLLVHHFILHAARAAADKAGTPAITVTFAPMLTPSRRIHPPGTPDFGEWGNALEWRIAAFALNRTLLKDVNRLRRRVGLPLFDDLMHDAWPSHLLNLMASSPALIERPLDWPPWHQLCGFLELPSHEHEPIAPDVEAFLRGGEAPVFMGFGSLMPVGGDGHLETTVAIFEQAARIAGCRAIIQSDCQPTAVHNRSATDRILFVKRTPHKLVFPRCAAVVHHAGAGTTHTTLLAGVPSIPVPHVSDQFAWSDELTRLGVAPRSIRRMKLTAATLGSRIVQVVKDPRMKTAAMAIAARM